MRALDGAGDDSTAAAACIDKGTIPGCESHQQGSMLAMSAWPLALMVDIIFPLSCSSITVRNLRALEGNG
jgi:hypothetical protein